MIRFNLLIKIGNTQRYVIGITKIMPSILSKKPPWPGKIFPVSFNLAFLLKYEIIKSPIWLTNEINKINKIINMGSVSKRILLFLP